MNDELTKHTKGENHLAKVELSNQFSKVMNFENREDLKLFATDIIKSKLVDIETPEDAMAVMMIGAEIGINPISALLLGKKLKPNSISAVMRGRQLGFDAITSIEKIYYFKNKKGEELSSVGIDIIAASLLRAGIIIEIVDNFVPLYGYADKQGNLHHPNTINWDMFQLVNKGTPKEDIDTNKIQVINYSKPVDYKTSIKFIRYHTIPGTKSHKQEHIETALYMDYTELHEKFNWSSESGKKNMLRIRCLAAGSRIIGDDITHGLHSTEILLDTKDLTPIDVEYEEIKVEPSTKPTNS